MFTFLLLLFVNTPDINLVLTFSQTSDSIYFLQLNTEKATDKSAFLSCVGIVIGRFFNGLALAIVGIEY